MKTLKQYLKGKTGLEYYARLKEMTEAELSALWEEVDEKTYWWFLEAVVPERQEMFVYVGGDPLCDGKEGTIYRAGVELGTRYFVREATLEKFDKSQYLFEIGKKFGMFS